MKSFFLSVSMVLLAVWAGAQQLHFVYLQTDSRKPFYVMLNNKNYSSSSIGYVILPKLQNGDYAVKVGFPRSEQAEQEFLLQVKDNDQGFLVKDFGEKGYGLFNLQSLDIQYAGTIAQKKAEQTAKQKAEDEARQKALAAQTALYEQRRTDSLQAVASAREQAQQQALAAQQRATTDSLAKIENTNRQAINADSVLQAQQATAASEKAQQQAAQRQADSLQQAATNATIAANRQATEETEQRRITDSLNKAQATTAWENEQQERIADSTAKVQAKAIEKAKQASTNNPAETGSTNGPVLQQKNFTDSGWRYTYAIQKGGAKEMIDVFIPVRKGQPAVVAVPVVTPAETPATTVADEATNTTDNNVVSTKPKKNKKPAKEPKVVIDNTPEVKQDTTKFLDMTFSSNTPVGTVVKTDSSGVKVLHNSNCNAMAEEKDFMNTRKKMVAADGTEKMVAIARKLMKEKCYTTEQIRNLSFLFLTDADRYQFLDAAYPFAVDAYRFNTLQDVLKDDYYVQRFKAMLR